MVEVECYNASVPPSSRTQTEMVQRYDDSVLSSEAEREKESIAPPLPPLPPELVVSLPSCSTAATITSTSANASSRARTQLWNTSFETAAAASPQPPSQPHLRSIPLPQNLEGSLEFEERKGGMPTALVQKHNSTGVRQQLRQKQADVQEGAESECTTNSENMATLKSRKKGYLKKYKCKAHGLSTFKTRYFVLCEDKLFWFKKKPRAEETEHPLGFLYLSANIQFQLSSPLSIEMFLDGKKLYELQAIDAAECRQWFKAFSHSDVEETKTFYTILNKSELRAILTRGSIFRKCRRGRHKTRLVWFSENLDTVFWGKPRLLRTQTKALGALRVADFVEICDGCDSSAKASSSLSFTIVTEDNTLELEAEDAITKRLWSQAIQQLIQH